MNYVTYKAIGYGLTPIGYISLLLACYAPPPQNLAFGMAAVFSILASGISLGKGGLEEKIKKD